MKKTFQKLIIIVMVTAGYEIGYGASANTKSEGAPQEYSLKSPGVLPLPIMAIDPLNEHIYGIAFEARGTPGCFVFANNYWTGFTNGVEIKSGMCSALALYGVLLAVNGEWQTGRVEVLTTRGTAGPVTNAGLVMNLNATGEGEVFIRNLRLVEGGFPENPPLAGAPYLRWINSLQPNRAWASAYPLKPAKYHDPAGDIERWKAETQTCRDLPVECLIELVPTRRSLPSSVSLPGKIGWDPRHPDVITNQDGTIFEVEQKYPLSGYQEVVAPSGKIVKYPYHDPPGTVAPVTRIEGAAQLPGECVVFGPFRREDAILSQAQLNSIPQDVTIGNRTLKGQRAKISVNQLDLGALMGGQEIGKTAYVFMEIQSTDDQTVTLGAGADYWMQWWVNGQPVYDTTISDQGNLYLPPAIMNYCFNVSLKKGTNVLAGRIISGSGGFVVAVGGPDELKQSSRDLFFKSPSGRVYLDQFMTSVRMDTMMRQAELLTAIYKNNGDQDAALRAAVILWALCNNIPDWPIYGQAAWNDRTCRFWPPDTYHYWFSFITGLWYTPAMLFFSPLARMYDVLRDAPVWEDLSEISGQADDPRQDIENGLLHAARMSLKMDADFRNDPFVLFHNTISSQLGAYITIGRAIGCPELVHYAIKKADCAYRYTFMADGMIPESVGYMYDMTAQINWKLYINALGFTDPAGFTAAVDGRHIENYDMGKDMPFAIRAAKVLDRLHFPDGTVLTSHDTWAQSLAKQAAPRNQVEPYLLPEFGHAILGHGTKPDWLESHLHYSGYYNHGQGDMLTFTLWAYGDELTADIGYSHIGGYEVTTLSHNLVVVDEKCQQDIPPYNKLHRGDLLAWYPNTDACQVVQAAETNVYPQTERYRRAIINVPFAPGQDAIVDIFETRGGRRHEWIANGCADYEQTVETTLANPVKKLPNLALDGQPLIMNVTGSVSYAVPNDSPGKTSSYYGAFTDASFYRNEKPWSLTMKPCPPVPAGTPGAGPRAVVTNEVRPGLRLHWLAPLDGEAIVCKAPRQRYFRECENEEEVRRAWNRNLMPKVIVRREAQAKAPLDSTFVAAWEPFRETPWIEQVTQLPVEESVGVGVRLAGSGNEAVVLYRKPEHEGTLRVKVGPEGSEELSGDGRFIILRRAGGQVMLDLYDGSLVQFGRLTARLKPLPPMKLLVIAQAGEGYSLIVEGLIPSYPLEAFNQPHAGQFIKFCQPGQVPRWLPLALVEKQGEGKTRLVLAREPGFEYDVSRNVLKETYFPFRTLTGPTNQGALVQFPNWLNVKWQSRGEGEKIELNASGDVVLEFKGLGKAGKAQIGKPDSKTTADLPVTSSQDGQVSLALPSKTLGKGWNTITLGK